MRLGAADATDGASRSGRPVTLLWSLGCVLVLLAAWHIAASRLPPIILPSITSTLVSFAQLVTEPRAWLALAESLSTFVTGFALAAALGAFIGVARGLSPVVRGAFAPLLGLLNSVPTIAWMGLAMIWFGLGMGPTVFIAVVTTTPILASALARAVEDRDPRCEELARVCDLRGGARLRHITLPPLLGSARAALATMAGLGWKLTIMGEFLTASRGLGEMLVEAKAHLQTDRVIAITSLLVLVWVLIDLLLRCIGGLRLPAFRRERRRSESTARAHPVVAAAGRDQHQEAGPQAELLLRCSELSLGYGVAIARGISFEIKTGSVTAVLGPSGVGKSTLLHVLGGLAEPLVGRVARRNGLRVSYVFQDDRLLPWRSLEQNVSLLSDAETGAVRSQLAELGLSAAADRMPDELSGGMRRRGALARGFLRDADLLLLDEPFAGLDPLRRALLIDDITRMRRVRGKAIVFVTHDIDDAVLLADEAIVLSGDAPAHIVERVDLSNLGTRRSATDPAAAPLRARLLGALLGNSNSSSATHRITTTEETTHAHSAPGPGPGTRR